MVLRSLPLGSKVRLKGLVNAAAYNGLIATVVSEISAENGRLSVVLDGPQKNLSIKPENFEVLGIRHGRHEHTQSDAKTGSMLGHGLGIEGVEGSFDWIVDYPQLEKHLTCESLGVDKSARILQVGCGTSELSQHIYDAGFHNITNVDIHAPTIEEMQQRHSEDRDGMRWLVADMTDASALFPDDHCFDLVLDKGTLDAMLCTDEGSALFCEVARLLAVGGTFVVISFRARGMMEKFLTVPDAPFSLRCECVDTPAASKIEAHIYFLCKTAPLTASTMQLDVVKKYQDSVIQWWHREQDPMLTADTEGGIRQCFLDVLHSRSLTDDDRLPLEDVHVILFSEEMRGEYGYDLESFRADIEGYVEEGGTTAPDGFGLSLHEALDFLRIMQ